MSLCHVWRCVRCPCAVFCVRMNMRLGTSIRLLSTGVDAARAFEVLGFVQYVVLWILLVLYMLKGNGKMLLFSLVLAIVTGNTLPCAFHSTPNNAFSPHQARILSQTFEVVTFDRQNDVVVQLSFSRYNTTCAARMTALLCIAHFTTLL
jgi:hypothetical protein